MKAEAVLNQFIKSGGKEEDASFSIRITWSLGVLCAKQKKLDLAKMLILKVYKMLMSIIIFDILGGCRL